MTDRRIHMRGPGVDAARKVANVGKALRGKMKRSTLAAHAVVALKDQQGIARQALQVFHGRIIQVPCTRNLRDCPFAGGANVDELVGYLCVAHGFQFKGRELSNGGGHRKLS